MDLYKNLIITHNKRIIEAEMKDKPPHGNSPPSPRLWRDTAGVAVGV